MLRFNNVSFKYPEMSINTLENINFELEKGEWLTIIGDNGSGKSTLTKLISGIYEKSEGEIFIDDKEYSLENINYIRKKIAIVFQNPENQFVASTVEEDVAFGLENRNVATEDMEDIIVDVLTKVDMLEFRKKEPRELSGGQKQRVAIAAALALKPEILILDEATSMLDPKAREEILTYIKKINLENKLSIISITHDAEELAYSDNVIVVESGRISNKIAIEDIYKEEYLKKFTAIDLPLIEKLKSFINKKVGENIFLPNDTEDEVISKLCKLILEK